MTALPPAPGKRLRCYGCGSTDLVLHETRYEHAEYDGGLFVNEQGRIQALDSGISTPGEIQPELTRIECTACGYDWHPRRPFAGSVELETRS